MCKIFKENGLNITVECNLAITDFLNVTFNLKSGTYYPYRKQNNIIYCMYINNQKPSTIHNKANAISDK